MSERNRHPDLTFCERNIFSYHRGDLTKDYLHFVFRHGGVAVERKFSFSRWLNYSQVWRLKNPQRASRCGREPKAALNVSCVHWQNKESHLASVLLITNEEAAVGKYVAPFLPTIPIYAFPALLVEVCVSTRELQIVLRTRKEHLESELRDWSHS